MSYVARAHAKVNVHLGVGDARADGYHELKTVFQSLSLFDELTLATNSLDSHEITVSGLGANYVPRDASNLVWRAMERALAMAGISEHFSVHLDKGIPTAGGMAGGSADAAATLRLINAVLAEKNKELFEDQLLSIAADLGSDIPFTLLGGTKLGVGRGEKLTDVPSTGEYHWALAFSSRGLSTPAVFRRLDEMRTENPELPRADEPTELFAALRIGDTKKVAGLLANDLQAPALDLQPALADTLHVGVAAGALRGIVSGSGPTCAFLCENAEAADTVARELLRAGVAASTTTASGPAPGAHVIANQ